MSLSFSLLVYPLLFAFGYAFSSVLHFVIEDYFDEYAVSDLFFHYSYIRCFACILVLSVVISAVLSIWKKYFFYEEDKDTIISAVKNIFKDCMLCISAFVSIYYCIKIVYLYLIGGISIPSLLKIVVNVGLIAVFMLFAFLDRKNSFNKNFKLFFRSVVSVIFLVVMSTVLCVCKFSDLGATSRIRADLIIFSDVKSIKDRCSNPYRQSDINDDIYSALGEEGGKNRIKYKINEDNVEVTFKIQSSETDRPSMRAVKRASTTSLYYYSDLKKFFDEYKQPGEYTKTFVRKKSK